MSKEISFNESSCLVILLAKFYKLPILPVFRGGSLPERFNKCPTLFELIFQKNQLVICPSSYLSIFFENKGISMDFENTTEIRFCKILALCSKNQEIVLYCQGGFRSALAAESLKNMGYNNVVSMSGGFGEWANNYPIS